MKKSLGKFWVVKCDKDKWIAMHSLARSRNKSIKGFGADKETWRYWRQLGYRCVRVEIRECAK